MRKDETYIAVTRKDGFMKLLIFYRDKNMLIGSSLAYVVPWLVVLVGGNSFDVTTHVHS